MTEPRRILVVSLGSIGQRHLRNVRSMLPEAEIAVYRQQSDPAGQPPVGADAVFFDLESAFEFAPGAVIIASPATQHIRCSVPFAEIGTSLFIEKPLADTAARVETLSAALQLGGGFAMVGYVLRFQRILHFVRQVLSSDLVGDLRTARVQVGQYLPDWRPATDYRDSVSARRALGGGVLLELSHELDYAMWLFGRPDSLMCSSAKLSDLDIDVEDSAHVILEYGDQCRVALQLDFLQRVPKMAIEIVGSNGTLDVDLIREVATIFEPAAPSGRRLDVPRASDGNEIYLRQFDFFFSQSFPDYQPSFAETGEFRDWVDVERGTDVLRTVDLARQSSREGRRVSLGAGRS